MILTKRLRSNVVEISKIYFAYIEIWPSSLLHAVLGNKQNRFIVKPMFPTLISDVVCKYMKSTYLPCILLSDFSVCYSN